MTARTSPPKMTEREVQAAIVTMAKRLGFREKDRTNPHNFGTIDLQQNEAGAMVEHPPAWHPDVRRSAMHEKSTTPLERRFWAKVQKDPSGCWQWTAFCDKAGYARLHGPGRQSPVLYAHRLSYELHNGPIPDGLHLDHLCRNTRCVNPDHLEAVTARVNIMRGHAPNIIAHQNGTCRSGHQMSGDNLYISPQGHRQCRTCRKVRRSGGAK